MVCFCLITGFRVRDTACCGIGRNQGQITCTPLLPPCNQRDQYVFWDAFHPTQAANAVLAQRAYTGSTTDCFPINVQQLAQIKFWSCLRLWFWSVDRVVFYVLFQDILCWCALLVKSMCTFECIKGCECAICLYKGNVTI